MQWQEDLFLKILGVCVRGGGLWLWGAMIHTQRQEDNFVGFPFFFSSYGDQDEVSSLTT